MQNINQPVYIRSLACAAPDWRERVKDKIFTFLQEKMPITLAKRVVSLIMICNGLNTSDIIEFSGYCKRSVATLRSNIKSGNYSSLLEIRGGGRPSVLAGMENEIIAALEANNFYTQQQIADMINDLANSKIGDTAHEASSDVTNGDSDETAGNASSDVATGESDEAVGNASSDAATGDSDETAGNASSDAATDESDETAGNASSDAATSESDEAVHYVASDTTTGGSFYTTTDTSGDTASGTASYTSSDIPNNTEELITSNPLTDMTASTTDYTFDCIGSDTANIIISNATYLSEKSVEKSRYKVSGSAEKAIHYLTIDTPGGTAKDVEAVLLISQSRYNTDI